MEEADLLPTQVRGPPALGGVVGVGARQPPDNGEAMDLDSVTETAGAGDNARQGSENSARAR